MKIFVIGYCIMQPKPSVFKSKDGSQFYGFMFGGSQGWFFRISASKHEDFAYIALNNNIEEEIKDFLNNPSWYDNHADRCPIGIFNQNYSAVFTIENGKNIAYVARNAQGRIRSFGEILYPESWMEKLEKRNVCSVMTDENTAPKFEQNFPYACAWKFWATGNKIDFGFDE